MVQIKDKLEKMEKDANKHYHKRSLNLKTKKIEARDKVSPLLGSMKRDQSITAFRSLNTSPSQATLNSTSISTIITEKRKKILLVDKHNPLAALSH